MVWQTPLGSQPTFDTNAQGCVANYRYFTDNGLQQVTYTNASGQALTAATPGVSFTHNPHYNRLASMTDGTGTTSFTYHPWASRGHLGALQPGTVDGPLPYDVISYTYDEVGRRTGRAINGVSETLAFDAKGRVSTIVNALGSFGHGYEGTTGRLASITYPGGTELSTALSYHGNSADRLLNEIAHSVAGSGVVAKFTRAYNALGNITRSAKKYGRHWVDSDFGYTGHYQHEPSGLVLAPSVRMIPGQRGGYRAIRSAKWPMGRTCIPTF